MSPKSCREFLTEEKGAVTALMIPWVMLGIGVGGLAVDGTRAFQVQTMLQATADAAALAATIDLPDGTAAIATALEYVEKNLPSEIYGTVVTEDHIEIGSWDPENRVFTPDASPPDAVLVRTNRTDATGNPVVTHMLRMVGFSFWDVDAVAIAQKFNPACFNDGLVARGIVDTSSNNSYYNKFCIHGEAGVHVQSGNYFEPKVRVSMPDLDLLQLPNSGMSSNPGLPDALMEGRLDPRMVDHVSEIIDTYLDPTSAIIPDYIDKTQPVIEVSWKFNLNNSVEGRIYHVVCPPNKQIGIPSQNVLSKVIVVSECQIGVPANAVMQDVILASRAPAGNDGANIHMSANIDLGKKDNCAPGGGVQIFTTESLFFSSSTDYNGVQIVSAKDVTLGASDEGVKGIAVQARRNIYLSSNNAFGICSGVDPLLVTHHYFRLVY